MNSFQMSLNDYRNHYLLCHTPTHENGLKKKIYIMIIETVSHLYIKYYNILYRDTGL